MSFYKSKPHYVIIQSNMLSAALALKNLNYIAIKIKYLIFSIIKRSLVNILKVKLTKFLKRSPLLSFVIDLYNSICSYIYSEIENLCNGTINKHFNKVLFILSIFLYKNLSIELSIPYVTHYGCVSLTLEYLHIWIIYNTAIWIKKRVIADNSFCEKHPYISKFILLICDLIFILSVSIFIDLFFKLLLKVIVKILSLRMTGNSGPGGRSKGYSTPEGDPEGDPSPGDPNPNDHTITVSGNSKDSKKKNIKRIKKNPNNVYDREPGETNNDYNRRIKKFELECKAAEGDLDSQQKLDHLNKLSRARVNKWRSNLQKRADASDESAKETILRNKQKESENSKKKRSELNAQASRGKESAIQKLADEKKSKAESSARITSDLKRKTQEGDKDAKTRLQEINDRKVKNNAKIRTDLVERAGKDEEAAKLKLSSLKKSHTKTTKKYNENLKAKADNNDPHAKEILENIKRSKAESAKRLREQRKAAKNNQQEEK